MDKTIWQESDSDRLIHQLYQTIRLFSKTLNQEIADTGIYSSEWTILNLIHHREDCAQTALSQYLGVEPAAISKTLTKMEKKGLIRASPIPIPAANSSSSRKRAHKPTATCPAPWPNTAARLCRAFHPKCCRASTM